MRAGQQKFLSLPEQKGTNLDSSYGKGKEANKGDGVPPAKTKGIGRQRDNLGVDGTTALTILAHPCTPAST